MLLSSPFYWQMASTVVLPTAVRMPLVVSYIGGTPPRP